MRRVIVTLLICVFALGMNAQDMTSVFTAMPDQYIPQLEHAWRKDLVDLYTSGKESRLKNTMNGFSTLQKLTNDYLLLQTTERSTVEMKLLPLVNNTYVVCMISTVNGPVPDSRIEFFTTNWEPLATSDLFTQPTSDWYIKQGMDKKDEAYQEHIRYTHDTYCRIVIRHASFDAARMLAARWKREISLEYLTEEKFVPLSTIDEYFQVPDYGQTYPFSVRGKTIFLDSCSLAAALAELPEQSQEEIFLYYFQHLKQKEIGEQSGWTRSTIGRHIQLALKRLKEEMEVLSHE